MRALALSLACLLAPPALGGLVARRMLLTLNDPLPGAPALLAQRPAPAAGRLAGRAVVVLLDGVGEAWLGQAAADGALGPVAAVFPVDTGTPSLSRPGYHALLTGVPPWASGVRANAFTAGRAHGVPDRVREAGGSVAFLLDGVPWFHELFGAGEPLGQREAWSAERFEQVWKTSTTLAIVHLTTTDSVAHAEGTERGGYAAALADELAQVGKIRAIVEASADRGKTWMFVGSDHGHRRRGGHGGPEEEVRRVRWFALGPGGPGTFVARRSALGSMAGVIAGSMGLAPPAHALLPPPEQPLFFVDGGAVAGRAAAVGPAIEALRRSRQRDAQRRGAALLPALAAALYRLRSRAAALAPSLAGLALFAAAGPGLSVSSVQNERSYIEATVGWTALGAALAWPAARALGARFNGAAAAGAALPLAALWVTLGSSGASGLGDEGSMALMVAGMAPAGAALGLLAAAAAARVIGRKIARSPV